jgi:hypothetical protein
MGGVTCPHRTTFKLRGYVYCEDCGQPVMAEGSLDFDGATFLPSRDGIRLRGQLDRVMRLMLDGRWRGLEEICLETGDRSPAAESRAVAVSTGHHGVDDSFLTDPWTIL